MAHVTREQLYEWCRIPPEELVNHPGLCVPFRLVRDSQEMGRLMVREFVELIKANNGLGRHTRAIIPCGPSCWYEPWTCSYRAVSSCRQQRAWQGFSWVSCWPLEWRCPRAFCLA